jgi:bacterioferritin-associated ferredoxin
MISRGLVIWVRGNIDFWVVVLIRTGGDRLLAVRAVGQRVTRLLAYMAVASACGMCNNGIGRLIAKLDMSSVGSKTAM